MQFEDSFTCPYCDATIPISKDTYRSQYPSFESSVRAPQVGMIFSSELRLHFIRCPRCHKQTIFSEGLGDDVKDVSDFIKPKSLAKQFPDYIPLQIRQDYEEAYSISNLSPKASATLCRRALQGMIHDFWNIHEKDLNAEITALMSKVTPSLWKVLDGIRKLGNIGAHMERDVNLIIDIDIDEVNKLLKLIEYLIKEWYITRHDTENLFEDIINISEDKQNRRKKND